MSWLKSARDSATQWWTGEETTQTPQTGDSDQELLGNQEVQERTETPDAPQRAGTVVAKAGDTISGLAKAGTGDVKRYPELNEFNQRDPEDASLEPLDVLYVPVGWDVVAMGGIAEDTQPAVDTEPEKEEAAPSYDPRDLAQGAAEQAVDVAQQGADWVQEKASQAYAAWMGSDTGQEMADSHDASKESHSEEPASGSTRDTADFVKKEDGKAEQTVDVGEDGQQDSTLELAETRADLGDEGTHYKRDGTTLDDKMEQTRGEADRDTFWCSGLSLWTLGAAGYDLEKPLEGNNGEAHGYVDSNGYMPIKPFMLIDGQWEAVQAMGRILEQAEDPSSCPGYTVWIATNAVRDLDGVTRTIGTSPDANAGTLVAEGSSSVDKGFSDLDLYEEGTTDSTDARADYDDSLAVMGAAGAFELMNIGHRVGTEEMKPGDFGQTFYKNGGKYWGKGHAYQIWSVTVTGGAWFGTAGSPSLVDQDTPTERTWLQGVTFVIDKDTDPSLVGEDMTLQSYQAIEANIGGAGDTDLTGDGGVDITDDRTPEGEAGTASEDRRTYYGRLFENPWSNKNWVPASAEQGTQPDVTEEATEDEQGGALDPLWRAIGWD